MKAQGTEAEQDLFAFFGEPVEAPANRPAAFSEDGPCDRGVVVAAAAESVDEGEIPETPWPSADPLDDPRLAELEAAAEAAEEPDESAAAPDGEDPDAVEAAFRQARPAEPAAAPRRTKRLGQQEMRQAALGFLAAQRPAGVAGYVPARFRKYQVAAAAFWTRDFGRVKQVVRTAIVEIYDRRDRCFIDCADRSVLLEEIRSTRAERERREAEIRIREPQLADSDDLFGEFRTWHYERSADPEYRRLRRRLEQLQKALYQGSRLERIRRAGVADALYLAVPAGVLEPDEVAGGWGLLHVHADGRIELRSEPELQHCDPAARNHLALNIAAAAAHSVLFAAGVGVSAAGELRFYRPPRRRLKRTMF